MAIFLAEFAGPAEFGSENRKVFVPVEVDSFEGAGGPFYGETFATFH
jgi:hypothetical protein